MINAVYKVFLIGLLLFLCLFPIEKGLSCNTPYSLDKFKPILNISKLQAPYSKYNSLFAVKYGGFKDVCNQFFNLQDNRYMTFFMCQKNMNDHKRSELRFKDAFKVSSQKVHILEARLKIFPLNQHKEFTFLQIHADSTLKNAPTINKPLLRISWWSSLHNIHDHLWAVIRLGIGKYSKYAKIDLGKRPQDFFNVKIIVKNSHLSVFVNGKEEIKKFDVSYWNKFYNYFKAGVYLQGTGCSKVLFDKLIVKGSE